MGVEKIVAQIKITKAIPDIFALVAGASTGYCDAHGISFGPEWIDTSLRNLPTTICALRGGFYGLVSSVADEDNSHHTNAIVKGGVFGALLGVVETGLGYCVGYTAGSLIK